MARTFRYNVTVDSPGGSGPDWGWDDTVGEPDGVMVGTVPVSDPPTYIAVGNVTAEGDGLGKESRIFSFAVYPTGIEAFTNEEAAPYDVYDGSEITEIRIEHSGGVKTVTSAQWSGSAGTGFIYLWYPDTDVIWDATDQGLTYYVEIDTNAPAAASFDAIDIIREDFQQASSSTGTASVTLSGCQAGETILISVSAQNQNHNFFALSGAGTGETINFAGGYRTMPVSFDNHQWAYMRVETTGDKTLTVITNGFNFPAVPVAIRAWRLSGVAVNPIVDVSHEVGPETYLGGNFAGPTLSLSGDTKYNVNKSGAGSKTAMFVVSHVTNGQAGNVTNAGFIAETVNDYGGANSDVAVDVDTYVDTGALTGYTFDWDAATYNPYLVSAISLRSQNQVDAYVAQSLKKNIGGGRAGVAFPATPRTATSSVVFSGGRKLGRG